MKESNKSAGGYIMLVGLVALLAAPIIVDHMMNPAEAATTVSAPVAAKN